MDFKIILAYHWYTCTNIHKCILISRLNGFSDRNMCYWIDKAHLSKSFYRDILRSSEIKWHWNVNYYCQEQKRFWVHGGILYSYLKNSSNLLKNQIQGKIKWCVHTLKGKLVILAMKALCRGFIFWGRRNEGQCHDDIVDVKICLTILNWYHCGAMFLLLYRCWNIKESKILT